ncbi:MAG: glycoside hydrolase family 3 C-terminal domain-containing protein [Actinobacteria bacterium]|nr:glycoside hydrolase family 3 C-terminal domain-containing protein [Actinomycetota bacterium]
MTDIDARIALTGGRDFWNTHALPDADLPAMTMTDGPHGVRLQVASADHVGINESEPATCFPPAVGLASSWSPAMLAEVGAALAAECRALNVGVLLGPGMNIKRSPLCGRNFEYFAEDPLVAGELASALVNGIQSGGVGTSVKHFAANNQETDRMRRDSQVDERTLREIYLRGFAKVVRSAKPWTVMCSYNKLNGVQVSENHWLLTEVLRDEWGYDGVVVSDWGAVWNRVNALKAGLDLEMPANQGHEDAVRAALAAGEIDEATIEQAAGRVEAMVRKAMAGREGATDSFDVDAHHALARKMAEQCVVLLSNDGVLPLKPETKVAVVGEFARTPRYQGAGSSRVNPTRLDNALDAIQALVGHEVPFAPGFTTAPGQELAADAHDRAIAVAREADVVLAFLGLGESHESEGYDRETCDLPAEQLALLKELLSANPNVVVVLSNGSSVLLPFADKVRAIVEGWLLGQAGGSALADVLYGVVNPSGKITETIPRRLEDVPSFLTFPGDLTGVRYGEGLFVGYRGYDAARTEVEFPFGHGLSYTTFDYSGLAVTATDAGLDVSVTVTNTGTRAGREVVQAYVSLPSSRVERAPRELKAFADVTLEPGEAAVVQLPIPSEELAYWSVLDGAWIVEGGTYTVEVGASSRDLRLSAEVALTGNEPVRPVTLNSTLEEAFAVPGFAEAIGGMVSGIFGEDDPDLMRMMAAMPLAALVGFSGRPESEVQALLDALNAQNR